MAQQTKPYPHTQYELISDINSLIDKIEANKQVLIKKQVSKRVVRDYQRIELAIKDLEALRSAIANIQW